MGRRLLTVATSLLTLGTPAGAAPAGDPAVYRGVVLSTRDATVTPDTCSTGMRAAVYYTDPDRRGPPAGSGIVVSHSTNGSAVAVVGSVVGWRNGVSSVTYALRLCGLGATFPETGAGWYRVAVRLGPGAPLQPRAGFTVRYRGLVHLDAGPEPVRRGAFVTLRASVTDGWEYFDTHPIRLSFRRAGATAWRSLGSVTPRCDRPCGDGEVSYTATRRLRQTVSGVWAAVSARTAYLESGRAADAVSVAGK